MKYTAEQIIKRMSELKLRTAIPSDYWICGIRSSADAPDKFDDEFYLFKGTSIIKATTGTTNPGKPVLTGGFKKYNKLGAAVVASNVYYQKLWTFGYHNGKVKALKQTGPILVYRDGDMDSKSEELGKPVQGDFDINFHCATYKLAGLVRTSIGAFSAGCMVCNNDNDYSFIIDTVKNQKLIDFCLLKEF